LGLSDEWVPEELLPAGNMRCSLLQPVSGNTPASSISVTAKSADVILHPLVFEGGRRSKTAPAGVPQQLLGRAFVIIPCAVDLADTNLCRISRWLITKL